MELHESRPQIQVKIQLQIMHLLIPFICKAPNIPEPECLKANFNYQ